MNAIEEREYLYNKFRELKARINSTTGSTDPKIFAKLKTEFSAWESRYKEYVKKHGKIDLGINGRISYGFKPKESLKPKSKKPTSISGKRPRLR